MKLFLHVHTRDGVRTVNLNALSRDAWNEQKHPRGQPQNKGEFTKKGGGSGGTTQPRYAPAKKTATHKPEVPFESAIHRSVRSHAKPKAKTPQATKPPIGTPAAIQSVTTSQSQIAAAVNTYNASGKTEEDQKKALTDIAKSVFDFMGIDKSVGFKVEEPISFKVGNKQFKSGGWYDPKDNAVTICTNTRPDNPHIAGLISHEAMHAKFHAVQQAYEKEDEALFNAEINDEEVRLPNGNIKPEYQAKYPMHTVMPNGFSGNLEALQEDDGITEYSQAYWKGVSMGSNKPNVAVDETIAEMARLDREGQLSTSPWFKNSKSYRPLYEGIHKLYPMAIGAVK